MIIHVSGHRFELRGDGFVCLDCDRWTIFERPNDPPLWPCERLTLSCPGPATKLFVSVGASTKH